MKYKLYEKLNENIDLEYKEFNTKILATVKCDEVLGVRIPVLRKIVKEFQKEDQDGINEFLSNLPHKYYEENMIHGLLIQDMKDFDSVISYLDMFLPLINTWSLTDSIYPRIFKKRPPEISTIKKWLNSGDTYTIRFGILSLMLSYTKDLFKKEYLDLVLKIKSNEYYVNMIRAWFFQVALLYHYDITIKYIEENKLDKFTHNKTIQKSIESFRISEDKKEYLKTLRRK